MLDIVQMYMTHDQLSVMLQSHCYHYLSYLPPGGIGPLQKSVGKLLGLVGVLLCSTTVYLLLFLIRTLKVENNNVIPWVHFAFRMCF